jgi:pyruvate/2-oxoglutarate dehydrogenase complex dihydrolipoamide dehydrogenase (E3) component/mono/diheme cytochrome c family protein
MNPLEPWDEHNRALIDNVHPATWVNPKPQGRYNLVVIGGGTAGLVTAAGAAGLGAKVALVERHLMGGDCLNYGCVPSKALLRAARAIAEVRAGQRFGVQASNVTVDFPKIMERMRRLRAQISPHDSAKRFRELGVDVFLGAARFAGRRTIEVGGQQLEFAKAVIATGARPGIPKIEGLSGYFTNETIFNLTALPRRLAIVGGGPIGCELAQAFQRFGSEVSLIQNGERILPRDDPDAAKIVDAALRKEGVRIYTRAKISRIDNKQIHLADGIIDADEILIAAGRAANVEGLNLEVADVAYDKSGVTVDDYLRTTNRRIYAAGDICLPYKFTHLADATARIAIQNALFAGRKKWTSLVIPWCTYTDPEIAHVGRISDKSIVQRMENVDRAILDDATDGLLKLYLDRDKVIGATLVSPHAGEMISELTLAVTNKLRISALAKTIHCYPTQAEIIKRAADAHNRSRLTPSVKKWLGRWLKLSGSLFVAGILVLISSAFGQSTVIPQLGCANCHSDLPLKSNLREFTPDLSSAGLRYEPAWLFEFLRKPVKLKRHLGPARMPNFRFINDEAIALVAFLETQKVVPDTKLEIPETIKQAIADNTAVSSPEFQRTLTNGLICLSCHTFDGKGGAQGIELSSVAHRLRSDWVKEYLVAPSRFGVAHTVMPAQFFDPTNQFRELLPQATRKIQVIAGYLASLNSSDRKSLKAAYEAAKAAFPNATPELGREIFVSQNCAACHRHHTIEPREQSGPELTKEAARVTAPWLSSFLKRPHAIRPFGYSPGDGSRMPDFALSDPEIRDIVATLAAQPARSSSSAAISAFAKRKAKLLLNEKLSCLGCHQFGETGGRIGPDLTVVRERLQPDYVNAIIRNPRETNPHTIMPQVPLSDAMLTLITTFLFQHADKPRESNYLSLTANRTLSLTNNYAKYCGACHGEDGQGTGYNAAFLPKKPTAHASAAGMSRRPDDTLYDAIHSGGYIVNKSHFMPPWGQTLSSKQIRDLVTQIRTLCECAGPAWSRDNRK